MKKTLFFLGIISLWNSSMAQTNPAITSWLRNTTSITGRHYVSGNSTPIADATLANVQKVQYSAQYVYVSTNGIPSYVTGPFLDGNPNLAGTQNAIFKFPLTPTPNTGTSTPTTGGNIGVFINGVALFDYRDGVSYKSSTGLNAGGPSGGTGDGVWNRDAVLYEKTGFDCAKGHPAGTNYHHHQNPSAFNLDLKVISNICNLYLADGLYVINPAQHSPLLGFAYDGYPIYGAFGYKNVDGTGGITRIKSGFSLRNIATRTTYYTGIAVASGPTVSINFPLGMYKEDYQFTANAASDYLDIHNGRFCVTPEYPNGTYAYFCTVDSNYNSTYPYVVGPTFYGTKVASKLTSAVTETTTTYSPVLSTSNFDFDNLEFKIYPNPASDLIAIQSSEMIMNNLNAELIDERGRIVATKSFLQGSTICHFETDTLYNGIYFLKISNNTMVKTYKIFIQK
ncbi:YHYH protein [Flavobacterium psychrotolerans]|uniref:YHYH domain-containing protein n=1 Tax=Flavobacterium psychrotolerans TaxID=2169410 RepID=A0A2U1JLW8_9FLAO|nr:YHYH protein [Flavobacterium psychrotolerans]PWA05974.1 hypothetical protein DB895_05425 [Flavobacterium psychrotolerans]